MGRLGSSAAVHRRRLKAKTYKVKKLTRQAYKAVARGQCSKARSLLERAKENQGARQAEARGVPTSSRGGRRNLRSLTKQVHEVCYTGKRRKSRKSRKSGSKRARHHSRKHARRPAKRSHRRAHSRAHRRSRGGTRSRRSARSLRRIPEQWWEKTPASKRSHHTKESLEKLLHEKYAGYGRRRSHRRSHRRSRR